MYDPYAELVKNILPNRLEVHSVFWDRPWVTAEIVVHSGGREDPVSMPGLAHFVEHMISQNIPNWERDKAEEFFDEVGGDANFGSTSYLSTRYKFTVPADRKIFQKALLILGSMLLNARIENKTENQRSIILSEFHRAYPMLERLNWDMSIRKEIFTGHRLETYNRPLGRIEGINSVNKEDLQNFYDRNYVPANMSFVIVGGIQTEDIISDLAESPFGEKKLGCRNKIPAVFKDLPIPSFNKREVTLPYESGQIEYETTWAFPYDFSHYAMMVFKDVLNQILFDEIRDKRGISYSIGVGSDNFQDIFECTIAGNIKKEAINEINDLVNLCISVVPDRLDLFHRMSQSALQSCLMIDLSGISLKKVCSDSLERYHRIINIKEVIDSLNKVRKEDMAEASKILCPERQYSLIAHS